MAQNSEKSNVIVNTSEALFIKKEKSRSKKIKAVYSFERFLDKFKKNARNDYYDNNIRLLSGQNARSQRYFQCRFSSFQTPPALLYNKQRGSNLTPSTLAFPLLLQRQEARAKAAGYSKMVGPYTHLFLRKNANYTRNIHPVLRNSLRGCTTVTGFKKSLYSKIKIQDHRLLPSYNRRKHNHSHYMVIENQLRNTSKTFQYISRTRLRYIIAASLKNAHTHYRLKSYAAEFSQLRPIFALALCSCLLPLQEQRKGKSSGEPLQEKSAGRRGKARGDTNSPAFLSPDENASKAFVAQKRKQLRSCLCKSKKQHLILPFCFRPIPALVSFIEMQLDLLVWRNLFNGSLIQSRQILRYEKNALRLANKTAVVLSKS
jgi:hypothetical protein